jgi:hypothetical protein
MSRKKGKKCKKEVEKKKDGKDSFIGKYRKKTKSCRVLLLLHKQKNSRGKRNEEKENL